MKIKAYARNITDEECVVIRNMAKVVTDQPIEVIDVDSYEVEYDTSDILLIYGPRALKMCSAPCRARLEFSDIGRLTTAFGADTLEKVSAYAELKLFQQKLLDSDHTEQETEAQEVHTKQVEDPLPAYDANQVEALYEGLKKIHCTEWTGITDEGRTVRLTVAPAQGDYDINMTFAELYALKSLKEVLHVKELTFVYNNTNPDRKNSPR